MQVLRSPSASSQKKLESFGQAYAIANIPVNMLSSLV